LSATLRDVAEAAGVGKSTASVVLNNKPNRIEISEKTRRKIFQAAEDLGYHPSAAARALATNRTGYIGFILSDIVADGLANAYYARFLAAAEEVCRERGYGLNVSLYNLSNLSSFVFPAKVGQRCMDGLILADHVTRAVAEKFREFGVPCVAISEETEVEGLVPTVACAYVDGIYSVLSYLASLGHRRIGYHASGTRRGHEVVRLLTERMKQEPSTAECELVHLLTEGVARDYSAAPHLLQQWRAMPDNARMTAMIGTDQTVLSLLDELEAAGLACPRDLSLIADADTPLCRLSRPRITALSVDIAAMGRAATEMLIDHLEDKAELTVSSSQNDFPCRLVERNSCAPPAGP
jgi:DNA-binding LacI/PurR family transcriptional regulator